MSDHKPQDEEPQAVSDEELEDAAGAGGKGFMNIYSNGGFYSGASVNDF